MKQISKLLAVLLSLSLLCCAGLALGEEQEEPAPQPAIDLSGMEVKDLLRLRHDIGEELYSRGEAQVVTAGSYLVGRDIAPGSYILTPHNGNENYLGFSWDFVIYTDEKAQGALERAETDYHEALKAALAAQEAGEEAVFPEPVDVGAYRLQQETCTNAVSMRITLEEGQVFTLGYWRLFDKTVEVVIEKTQGLFME